MILTTLVLSFLALTGASYTKSHKVGKPDKDGKYTISSKGIKASFIPYGASLTNLWVPDKHGKMRDITLGFDTAYEYTIDKKHPHFGGVPGRYANRIKNSTFTIDGKTYHVDANDNGGLDTLHGGSNGWDYRNFTVSSWTSNSITFKLFDPDGTMGFPGDVHSTVTYTVTPGAWHFKMSASATTKKTPIMLTSHSYWNLDAFESELALDHVFSLPHSGLTVDVDNILIPTGNFNTAGKGNVNDFWSKPKKIGQDLMRAVDNCGKGCTGYDNCWLVNGKHDKARDPVASMWSEKSGIKVDILSEQDAFQMYSCNFQDGTIPVKSTQKQYSKSGFVQKYGCIVMEVQDYIDGINHPEWFRLNKQIFGPEDPPYVVTATYKFSTLK